MQQAHASDAQSTQRTSKAPVRSNVAESDANVRRASADTKAAGARFTAAARISKRDDVDNDDSIVQIRRDAIDNQSATATEVFQIALLFPTPAAARNKVLADLSHSA